MPGIKKIFKSNFSTRCVLLFLLFLFKINITFAQTAYVDYRQINPQVLTVNLPMVSLVPTIIGGTSQPFVFSLDTPLPAGISLNTSNGVISGTPSIVSPQSTYSVTAFNGSQSVKLYLRIQVNAALLPPDISYITPRVFPLNEGLQPVGNDNKGGVINPPEYSGSGASNEPYHHIPYGWTSGVPGIYLDGFSNPTGITEANGDLYAADQGNNLLKKMVPSFPVVVTTGLNKPGGLTTLAGNVYIAEVGNNVIKKLNTITGITNIFAGNGTAGFADGPAMSARFNKPTSIVADANGNLYVADSNNNRIRKIDPAGNVTTFAGTGTAGFLDGPGSTAMFNNPSGVAIDASGNVYVADAQNHRIRKITPAGIVSTIAGDGTPGYVNGPALSARFNTPTALATGTDEDIFIVDSENHQIRRITHGVVSTFIGRGNFTAGFIQFEQPVDIYYNPNGLLYVSDLNIGKSVVAAVSTVGYTIDKPLPNGLTLNGFTGEIGGTPIELSPPTDYVITAYNTTGSSSTTVNIAVGPARKPSVITFPSQSGRTFEIGATYDTGATSTNNETPIKYVSTSNSGVAIIEPDGTIRIVGLGTTSIVANQDGNANYLPAMPAMVTLKVQEEQFITFPPIAQKTTCDVDFSGGATSNFTENPITYTSSNTAVATVNNFGMIHIVGPGTTTITANQAGSDKYVEAPAVSQTLVVTSGPSPPPSVSITADVNNVKARTPITFNAIATNAGTVISYQWKVNRIAVGTNSPTYTSTLLKNDDKVTCTIVSNIACTTPAVSNTLSVTILPIKINTAFTPNGDGVNDTWNIPDLIVYPDCMMRIFNRSGQLVFQSRGYTKAWDGTYNGRQLPLATYYYVLSLDDTTPGKQLSGPITIVR